MAARLGIGEAHSGKAEVRSETEVDQVGTVEEVHPALEGAHFENLAESLGQQETGIGGVGGRLDYFGIEVDQAD